MWITLTRDLSPKKGMMTGEQFDWPRPVITEMSKQVARNALEAYGMDRDEAWALEDPEAIAIENDLEDELDWFKFGQHFQDRMSRIQAREDRRSKEPEIEETSQESELVEA